MSGGRRRGPSPRPLRVVLASAVGDLADSHTLLYAQSLVRAGMEVVLLRPGNPADVPPLDGLRVDVLPTIRNNFWLYRPGVAHLLGAVLQRIANSLRIAYRLRSLGPDVVVTTEPDGWALAALARGCGWARYRLVEDLREIYEERASAFPKPVANIVYVGLRWLQRLLSGATDEIIHMSPERQRCFAYLKKRGVVVQYAPDLRSEVWREAASGTRKAPSDGRLIAVHAGALRHNYAGEVLVDACALLELRGVPVVIEVLGGVAGYLQNQALLDELVAAGRVRIEPPQPFAGVVRRLHACDIGLNLVLPIDTMHRLAQPRKLFEYFAAGLPVIVSDMPTLKRLVTERDAGEVVAHDSSAELADAIERMVYDRERRDACAARARAAAVAEFNWAQQEGALLSAVTG